MRKTVGDIHRDTHQDMPTSNGAGLRRAASGSDFLGNGVVQIHRTKQRSFKRASKSDVMKLESTPAFSPASVFSGPDISTDSEAEEDREYRKSTRAHTMPQQEIVRNRGPLVNEAAEANASVRPAPVDRVGSGSDKMVKSSIRPTSKVVAADQEAEERRQRAAERARTVAEMQARMLEDQSRAAEQLHKQEMEQARAKSTQRAGAVGKNQVGTQEAAKQEAEVRRSQTIVNKQEPQEQDRSRIEQKERGKEETRKAAEAKAKALASENDDLVQKMMFANMMVLEQDGTSTAKTRAAPTWHT